KTPREITDYRAAVREFGRALGFWGHRLQDVHEHVCSGNAEMTRPDCLVRTARGPGGSVASSMHAMVAGLDDHGMGYKANSQSRKRYLDAIAGAPPDRFAFKRADEVT